MGIFNFFITLPQIVSGVFGGLIVKYLYGGEAIYSIVLAGIFFIIAAISVLYVRETDTTYTKVALAESMVPKAR